MAQQIKKKFIGNDQVGENQLLIENGGSVRAMDGATEVDLVSISSNEVFLKGVKVLDSSNLIPSAILPSYVDDILEFADLASFPESGETGKIYVAIDTNKQYRWSGSDYVQITSGAVDSVNGETGIVVLTAGDIQMDSEAVSVESKLVSLQNEIDAEETARTNADSAIQSELDDTQSGAGLESDGSYLANGLSNYLSTAISLKDADDLLDTQVKANEDAIAAINSVQYYNEKYVVDAQILSDGFITLSNTPESGSIVAFVDRLGIFEGASEDFTVSGAVMTFLNELVSTGNQALQVGDEIRVKYRA